ncbi:MAG TPA: YcxB family protein [Alphaproteobacteria bacterium]
MTFAMRALEYTLTKEDMLHWSRYTGLHPRFSGARRRWSWIYLAYVALLVFLAIVISQRWVQGGFTSLTNILIAVIYAAILILGLYFEKKLWWWIWRRRQKRQLDRPIYALHFQPTRVEVTEAGIRFITEYLELLIRWRGLAGLGADEHGAYVYYSQSTGRMVPRRAFAEVIDFDRFVLQLKELHRQFGANAEAQAQPQPA